MNAILSHIALVPMTIVEKIRRSNIEVHNREASIYDAVHPEIFGSFEQHKILRDLDLIASIIPPDPHIRVLDIGCGTGNLALKYLERGYSVTAVDISPVMISTLESKINPPAMSSIQLVVGDAQDVLGNTQTYGTWQIISFSSVLHHLPDYDVVVADALRQLCPGGILYICHEPLRQPGRKNGLASPLACTILNGIDTLYIYARKLLVYSTQSLRGRTLFKRIDYRWSDYHSGLGIDAQEILRRLEHAGASTLVYETYRSRYSSLLAALDARLRTSEHSHFRLIVRR